MRERDSEKWRKKVNCRGFFAHSIIIPRLVCSVSSSFTAPHDQDQLHVEPCQEDWTNERTMNHHLSSLNSLSLNRHWVCLINSFFALFQSLISVWLRLSFHYRHNTIAKRASAARAKNYPPWWICAKRIPKQQPAGIRGKFLYSHHHLHSHFYYFFSLSLITWWGAYRKRATDKKYHHYTFQQVVASHFQPDGNDWPSIIPRVAMIILTIRRGDYEGVFCHANADEDTL